MSAPREEHILLDNLRLSLNRLLPMDDKVEQWWKGKQGALNKIKHDIDHFIALEAAKWRKANTGIIAEALQGENSRLQERLTLLSELKNAEEKDFSNTSDLKRQYKELYDIRYGDGRSDLTLGQHIENVKADIVKLKKGINEISKNAEQNSAQLANEAKTTETILREMVSRLDEVINTHPCTIELRKAHGKNIKDSVYPDGRNLFDALFQHRIEYWKNALGNISKPNVSRSDVIALLQEGSFEDIFSRTMQLSEGKKLDTPVLQFNFEAKAFLEHLTKEVEGGKTNVDKMYAEMLPSINKVLGYKGNHMTRLGSAFLDGFNRKKGASVGGMATRVGTVALGAVLVPRAIISLAQGRTNEEGKQEWPWNGVVLDIFKLIVGVGAVVFPGGAFRNEVWRGGIR